jgi:hypothetical protein
MEQCPLLPHNGLPATSYPASAALEWLSTDTREHYLKTGGHPVYGEHDIEYRFNSRGYRCEDFKQTRDVRIVAIGCSHVMGIGLPARALFHELFAERLRFAISRRVIVSNLGLAGASNDYIARTLHLAVPYLNPKIVLVNFTYADRREYISIQGKWIPYCPGYEPRDLVGREIKRHFEALSSPFDDEVNLFRNYKAIEALLADRFWLFSATARPGSDPAQFDRTFAKIRSHLDIERYVGQLHRIDPARDWSHFGPMSHEALAERYWSRFCNQDGPRIVAQ